MNAAAPDASGRSPVKKPAHAGFFSGSTVGFRSLGKVSMAALRRLPRFHGGNIIAVWKSGFD
jgi:hypothetical protein